MWAYLTVEKICSYQKKVISTPIDWTELCPLKMLWLCVNQTSVSKNLRLFIVQIVWNITFYIYLVFQMFAALVCWSFSISTLSFQPVQLIFQSDFGDLFGNFHFGLVIFINIIFLSIFWPIHTKSENLAVVYSDLAQHWPRNLILCETKKH